MPRGFLVLALLCLARAVLGAHVARDASAVKLAVEARTLARIRAMKAPGELDAVVAAVHAARLPERLDAAGVQLAKERAVELGASPALLERIELPPAVASARMTAGRPVGAVIFVVDGLRRDILDGMLARGKLPNLAKHLLDRGLTVDRLVSVYPSVTPPNAATMLTGVLPDRHRIPALAWYDGGGGTARLYTSVRGRDINRDLPASEKTLWEHLRDRYEVATVGMPVERGAWYRWFHLFYPDRAVARVGAGYLDHNGWLPPVVGAWFLDLDSASHLHGTFSTTVEESLVKLDAELGRVADLLIRRGTYDRTLFVWASDHGSQPTLQNVDIVGDLARAGLACRTLDLSVDPFFPEAMARRLKGADAVAINLGAGTGSLYLRAIGGAADVEAALRRHPSMDGKTIDVIDTLVKHPAVDVVMFARAAGAYRVIAEKGAGEIASRRDANGAWYRYDVVAGADPLDVPASLYGRWMSHGDWIRGTAACARPGAVPGIAAFLACGRAGDIAFSSRAGVNFSRHFHTRGGYHGGLTAAECTTRFLVAGPGVPHARLAAGSMADVTPTLLALLDVPHDPAKLDGRSLLVAREGVARLAPGRSGACERSPGSRAKPWQDIGDRARLGFALEPGLEVHQLYRVPDWRLDARGDTAPWWPLLVPAAFPGSALQVDFRRPLGRCDLVASPGLVRSEHGVLPGDHVYPTLDLRASAPVTAHGGAWLGLTGGTELLGAGDRLRGRADVGVLATCELGRSLRAFGCAGPYAGTVSTEDPDARGMRYKSGLEVYTGGRGSAIVEAIRDDRSGRRISSIGASVNLPAF